MALATVMGGPGCGPEMSTVLVRLCHLDSPHRSQQLQRCCRQHAFAEIAEQHHPQQATLMASSVLIVEACVQAAGQEA